MIQRILHSRHFLACLLSAATGMALYFRAPFPEDNIFLRVMAIRSLSAFLFLKYSYTLFLYTTPYLVYSILLSGVYIFALKT
jgi:cytochrome b subunit of formate dehydrogenase